MPTAKVKNPRQADLWVSSGGGDRLTRKGPIHFQKQPSAGTGFRIDETTRFQRIDGFGASFSEAGMICLNALDAGARQEVVRALFDPEQGAGLSATVTFIGATDFSSAGPFYTYADKKGNEDPLEHFSISRDLQPDGVVPFIKAAQQFGSFAIQARIDYTPGWMMLNADFPQGQIIDPNCYETLAQYLLRYVRAYQEQGVAIDYLSPFNEPGMFTKNAPLEIGLLLRDFIAPLFARERLPVKFQLGDAPYRHWASKQYPAILDILDIRGLLSGITYHNYDWGLTPVRDDTAGLDGIAELHRRYPELALWMTESCYGTAFQKCLDELGRVPRLDFEDGDFWGRQIASELGAGASAWIYWNVILDETGGPWLTSQRHGYLADNCQHAVVIVNRKTKQITYTGLYYYLAHFSKFVRPGSMRVQVHGEHPHLTLLGFVTSGNEVVGEVINSGDREVDAHIEWRGEYLHLKLPATSICTVLWPAG